MDLVAEGTGLGRVLLYRRLLSLWVDEDKEEAEEEHRFVSESERGCKT